ncbi:MAG TPA: Rrf2 family transcriptional regulator [Bacteroidales bacterium]|nr:Rrf2 family transcriptional regulator [Bacteroidales bacterium]
MLSNSCKYGIRAVIFIASKQEGSVKVGLKQIGDELKIPVPYLAKILQILSKRKILDSSKGPHGGFSLLVPAKNLTLMDIVRAIDGADFFDRCYITGEKCNFGEPDKGLCLLHNDLRKEKERLTQFFTGRTVDSLVKLVHKNNNLII